MREYVKRIPSRTSNSPTRRIEVDSGSTIEVDILQILTGQYLGLPGVVALLFT